MRSLHEEMMARANRVEKTNFIRDMMEDIRKKHPVRIVTVVDKRYKDVIEVIYMRFGEYEFQIGIGKSAIDFQYNKMLNGELRRNGYRE